MTYDLAVWAGDRPVDDAAAAEEFQRLRRRHSGAKEAPAPRIAAYVEALLARYPDIGTEAGLDSPWATAPLLGEAKGPLVYFPMVWAVCEEVSAWAAVLAEEHGLQCFDPQQGRLRPVAGDADLARRAGTAVDDADLEAVEGWHTAYRRRDGRQTMVGLEHRTEAPIVAALTLDPMSSGVSVSATIGVRHEAVNERYCRFLGVPPGGLWTFGRSLADLIPAATSTRWWYTAERPAREVAEVLAGDLEQYGLPEVRPLVLLDGLIERMWSVPRHQAWDGLLAVACAVAGRREEARAALEGYAARTEGQSGRVAERTRRFVRAFAEEFEFAAK